MTDKPSILPVSLFRNPSKPRKHSKLKVLKYFVFIFPKGPYCLFCFDIKAIEAKTSFEPVASLKYQIIEGV